VVVAYPNFFQAYDTAGWTGWTRVNDGNGPAFFTAGNVDTYVNLKPVTATAEEGSSSTSWIVVAVIAVVAIALVAWLVMRRRRGREIDE
jgi:hypothetical protein